MHNDWERLLPWYANDTLDPGDRARLERHLAGCARCRSELAALRALGAAINALPAPALAGDLLARARARLDAAAVAVPEAAPARGGWWWEALRPVADLFRAPLPVRGLLLAQLALLVVLVAALWSSRERARGFETLSGQSAKSEAGRRARLLVAFAPGATLAQLEETLAQAGATIVGGPSAAGFYTLELAAAPDDRAAIARSLERLRAQPAVVRFAEPGEGSD